jgi:hypothetical protein
MEQTEHTGTQCIAFLIFQSYLKFTLRFLVNFLFTASYTSPILFHFFKNGTKEGTAKTHLFLTFIRHFSPLVRLF